jgi:hypothetical protein
MYGLLLRNKQLFTDGNGKLNAHSDIGRTSLAFGFACTSLCECNSECNATFIITNKWSSLGWSETSEMLEGQATTLSFRQEIEWKIVQHDLMRTLSL